MHLEKEFDVTQEPASAYRCVARDETLLTLFPETRTEIVESAGERRTVRSHYTALGQAGTATFHFTFLPSGAGGRTCARSPLRTLPGIPFLLRLTA